MKQSHIWCRICRVDRLISAFDTQLTSRMNSDYSGYVTMQKCDGSCSECLSCIGVYLKTYILYMFYPLAFARYIFFRIIPRDPKCTSAARKRAHTHLYQPPTAEMPSHRASQSYFHTGDSTLLSVASETAVLIHS